MLVHELRETLQSVLRYADPAVVMPYKSRPEADLCTLVYQINYRPAKTEFDFGRFLGGAESSETRRGVVIVPFFLLGTFIQNTDQKLFDDWMQEKSEAYKQHRNLGLTASSLLQELQSVDAELPVLVCYRKSYGMSSEVNEHSHVSYGFVEPQSPIQTRCARFYGSVPEPRKWCPALYLSGKGLHDTPAIPPIFQWQVALKSHILKED